MTINILWAIAPLAILAACNKQPEASTPITPPPNAPSEINKPVPVSKTSEGGGPVRCMESHQDSKLADNICLHASLADAKQYLRESLWTYHYDCPSGSCVETNAIEICRTLGAIDIRSGFRITDEGAPVSEDVEFKLTKPDADLYRLMWEQCKASTYQYWGHDDTVHVAFYPSPDAAKKIRDALGVSQSKSPFEN